MSEEYNKRTTVDVVKEVLFTIVVAVAFFAYWCLTLAVLSIIFLHVWRVQWEYMLLIAGGLALLSTIINVIRKVRKRREYEKVLEGLK